MVQGVAEVVPVSSSAQLVLVPWLLGWEQPGDRTAAAAALHAGSCLGILAVTGVPDRRTAATVLATSLPAAVAGLLGADAVERRLGRPPQLAALLAVAGAVLWAADHWSPQTRQVGSSQACCAALAQVAALVPGVSRSGATLTALRLAGVERAAAERFTLLMSLPVTAGAAGLTLVRSRSLPPGALVGAAAAGLSAAAAVRLRPVGATATAPALYRLALATVVAVRLARRTERQAP